MPIEKLELPPELLPMNQWGEDMAIRVGRKLNEIVETVNAHDCRLNNKMAREIHAQTFGIYPPEAVNQYGRDVDGKSPASNLYTPPLLHEDAKSYKYISAPESVQQDKAPSGLAATAYSILQLMDRTAELGRLRMQVGFTQEMVDQLQCLVDGEEVFCFQNVKTNAAQQAIENIRALLPDRDIKVERE